LRSADKIQLMFATVASALPPVIKDAGIKPE
jgi:hypothetical protein